MALTLKITSVVLAATLGFILTMLAVYGFFYLLSAYASSLIPTSEKLADQTLFLLSALFMGVGFVGGILGAIIGYAKIETYLDKKIKPKAPLV